MAGLEFSQTDHVYREIYGPLYFVHIIISVAFLPLFLFYAFKQLKTQTILNRIRFRNIILAAFVVIFVALIFQIILPALGIWLFEKELIFLLTFFVVYIFFTLRRYYFSSGYELSKAVIIILSVNISIILLNVIRWICVEMRKTGSLTSYWDVQDSYFVLNTVIGIVIFSIAYQLLKKIFPGGTYKSELEKKIQRLEQ